MKLTQLRPSFFKYKMGIASEYHGRPLEDGTIQWGGFPVDTFLPVDCIGEADGINFLCPLCYQRNRGEIGTHLIHIHFEGRGSPDHLGVNSEGRTSRWHVKGNDFHDLTLSPSIHVKSGCGWHGFVTHGQIKNA